MNPSSRPLSRESIPAALIAIPHWLCWRYEVRHGKQTKVPYQAGGVCADSTAPSTCTDFESAWQAASDPKNRFDGIGFVVTEEDEYCGIDLDGCHAEDGTIAPEAAAIVARLNSYTEITPSRTGLRIWVRGRLPEGARNSTGKVKDFKKIEFYDRLRYFTMTGWRLDGAPAGIESRQEELMAVHAEIFAAAAKETKAKGAPAHHNGTLKTPIGLGGNDEDLIVLARSAANGPKFSALFERGDVSGYGDDDSAADLALCSLLAFYCGPDPARIERLFGMSKLVRDKWTQRPDYRVRTIAKALEGRTEYYRAGTRSAAAAPPAGAPAARPGVAIPERPAFDGPGGLRLVATEARVTPTKTAVRFEVSLKGEEIGEIQGSNTKTGIEDAADVLNELVAGAEEAPVDPERVGGLRAFLRDLLTSKSVQSIAKALEERYAAIAANAPPDTRPSMREILTRFLQKDLDPRFQEPAARGPAVWSEALGRLVPYSESRWRRPPDLLVDLEGARDYPAPTDADPTKPLKHVPWEMDVAWTHLVDSLPEEGGKTGLGPGSKAAARFAEQLRKLWLTPETWMKEGGSVEGQRGPKSELVRRMSLASRARELAKCNRRTEWQHVHEAVNVFFAVETRAGRSRIWLAMREDACRYAIKGLVLPGVTSPEAFRTLLGRYGLLADPDGVPVHLADEARARGIEALHQRFAASVLADPDQGTPPPVDSDGPPCTPTDEAGSTEGRVDKETGEVLDG